MLSGILIADKAKDFTSHDVVAKLRGMLGTKKIGHAGTLDPMATGVLVIFIGSATKAIDRIPNHDKGYIATYQLGIITDTQDITGKVLEKRPFDLDKTKVLNAVEDFRGEILQIPPMYSAVQVGGKRLYDLARQGIEVERSARKISIYEYSLLEHNEKKGEYTFYIMCSKGTYIRTLCHDLGIKLGCGATLTSLRRTYANGFTLDNAFTLDKLQEMTDNSTIKDAILPLDTVFLDYKKLTLNADMAKMFCNGVPLWLNQFDTQPDDSLLRIYGPNDIFIGIAKADSKERQLSQQKRFIGEVSF